MVAIAGSVDEAWFDPAAILESDCSDDDFLSLPDDVLSLNSFDTTSLPNNSSLIDPSHGHGDASIQHASNEQPRRPGDSSGGNSARNSCSGVGKNSIHPIDNRSNEVSNETNPVILDEISSSSDGSSSGEDGLLNNCGILPSNCLPCLASTVQSDEKRKSLSSKKAPLKLSFKWKDGNSNASLLSSKACLLRPIAGAQVSFCPLEKKVPDSWSQLEPCTFRVRGVNYLRDKKKEFAPNYAAYYPFGVDVFLSPKKIHHVAQFVELPTVDSSGELPPILVVNVQVPLYPTAIFQGETDGKGMSFVLYFKILDNYTKELPPQFQENIKRFIDNELEKVRGFPVDSIVPYRERLKILGRVANVEDLPLNSAERKIMSAYNEKPVLSRPQHEFYAGANYFEIDIDMHRFSYISHLNLHTGNKAEELPEQVLCCIRLNEIDYVNYPQLG
ncbi:hypothetical protein Leryth_020460 [Lithospermum erythrorhizon]|nr:hypothetical protein Leryth_020460 [Lithospermum erythrorhizon]